MLIGRIGIIILMIALTAFFVAAEFGLVKIRKSRLESLEQGGNKNATLGLYIIDHLDEYLSACQLGITLTSLAIGWIGESTMEELLHPILSYLPVPDSVLKVISLVLAFLLITFVHVVIGELIPKSLSITKTEKVVLSVVKPLHYFYKFTYPFIWLLNSSANAIGKIFGFTLAGEGEETHSEEELRLIANQSFINGEINEDEYEFLNNVFEFDELIAKEIMVTRVDMETINEGTSVEDALKFAIEKGHSRFPVIRKTKDDVIGYVTMQDLVKVYLDEPAAIIDGIMQEPIIVIDSMPVKMLLAEMQKEHKHFAILSDEYGGTSGLVTIEDIIEEIVGDIQDEQDQEEDNIVEVKPKVFMVNGKTPLTEVEDWFEIEFPDDLDSNSLSGYITDTYQRDVKVNFVCQYEGLKFTVLKMDKVNISKLRITDLRSTKKED
ncbi:HlyC/CorC family transporter [Vagococcus coleopterorum]|uniref:HlyC/CorC family transporter n=1 Tax=Vagococcus coleopterorum TaxID=2714946 RepID=A0A6G8ANX9_9ENTE|nr:hemolysin family protein [Vagococcus coleopterorum]QIL46635.1 HlyC/CorC family transporter [Vagococcus coleopterorum]